MSLRFSIIDYLNALPLNLAFKDGLFAGRADLQFDFPSQCADNLASGRADVGLISSIEYQRIDNLLIAPQICIASHQEVRSVLILTKKDLSEVQTVALDRYSRSSVALLRILLHRRYQRRPNFLSMTPDPQSMLAQADAALIIGDAALRIPPGDWQVIDLAREWYQDTHLPFVFAFWAMRADIASAEVCAMLLKARAYGLAQLPSRLAQIQERWSLPEAEVVSYFRDNIHFELGPAELESLNRFYQYALEANLISAIKPPLFAPTP